MKTKIAGVILAGGSNKRFGGITKANIIINGEKIISRLLTTLELVFEENLIVTNSPEQFPDLKKYKITGDLYKNAGPLGGIHAAMKSASSEALFVFAGDMPFPDISLIRRQISEFESGDFNIFLPQIGCMIEPLHAIYRKSIIDSLEEILRDKKAIPVRDFIKNQKYGIFKLDDTPVNRRAFTNINSPSDIKGFNI
jgi:molybdopterin-guanine dinucleotide biosynthesis protein A